MTCNQYGGSTCSGYNYVSSGSMTIEKCLGICVTTYGFKYAGIAT